MYQLGIEDRDIFRDKQSGMDFNREQYQLLKRVLRKGDILYLQSLNHFGLNKEAILKEWTEITKEIEAHVVVLDMPLIDTTKNQDSIGNLVTDLVLQILTWLAEEERNKIKGVRKTPQDFLSSYLENKEEDRARSKRWFRDNNPAAAQRLREKLDKIH